MKLRTMLLLSVVAVVVLSAGFFALSPRHHDEPASDLVKASFWQRMAAPGELSESHAFLENRCAACHTPVKGVEAASCIACHAGNVALLQRQPSAFHSDISRCADCHLEHQGRVTRTTRMDHLALARIGLRQLKKNPNPETDERLASSQFLRWINQQGTPAASGQRRTGLTPYELILNCAACHGTKDRHFGLFGQDCAECHLTAKWTIPEFRHPAPTSQDCSQCHQAPPSHYMMHFKMVSMMVARVEKAEVNQCFVCHRTTAWNDIKGVGFYKHH
ncbi:MAG TPA: hypothetical protein VMF06_13850 [Candidatus Limnocylindria bacterium]|nr:hypothetical protein [Candidatus Limnocylindria bacterium]